jgi:hypothetical protein
MEQLLHMFPTVKSFFFLFQSNLPVILKKLFENELAEVYLCHLHSIMSMLLRNIQEIERERNSVLEVLAVLQSVCQQLQHRIEERFLSLKTQEILSKGKKDGMEKEADHFVKEACTVYKVCFEYLLKWTVSFNEFDCFHWMNLNDALSFSDVQSTIK